MFIGSFVCWSFVGSFVGFAFSIFVSLSVRFVGSFPWFRFFRFFIGLFACRSFVGSFVGFALSIFVSSFVRFVGSFSWFRFFVCSLVRSFVGRSFVRL